MMSGYLPSPTRASQMGRPVARSKREHGAIGEADEELIVHDDR
jgi:hypothetical protein